MKGRKNLEKWNGIGDEEAEGGYKLHSGPGMDPRRDND